MGHISDVTCEELALATNQSAYVIKAIDLNAGPSKDDDYIKSIKREVANERTSLRSDSPESKWKTSHGPQWKLAFPSPR
jgi:hypothetical protein